MFIELLDPQYIVGIMVGIRIGRGEIFSGFSDDEHLVIALKNAKTLTTAIIIEADHVAVEPYLPSSERARPLAFEIYTLDAVLRHQIPERVAPLDKLIREIYQQFRIAGPASCPVGFIHQSYPYCLRLAIGIGGKPLYAATGFTFGKIIFLLAGKA